MPTGVYIRTEFHKTILANNSSFKKGNTINKGRPSSFKGCKHTIKAKIKIGEKSKLMWQNPTIRKRITTILWNI